MTAVIHHGPPGSFKSFAIVQRVMIPALQAGREVVTNIRGFNDIDLVATALNITFPDSAKILYVDADSEQGFEYIARFFHWAPAGALIVIDEGQRAYPTRLKSLSVYDQRPDVPLCYSDGTPLIDQNGVPMVRPSSLENAFDQHRHCNWDIYISTPNIAKINKEIRGVVEWAYRHRDITGLNPFSKKSKWREFKHDAESTGKSVSHYFGTPATYTADKRVFGCYQSTKTGKAKTSNENISIFRDPKLRVFIGIFIISAIWFVSQINETLQRFDGKNIGLEQISVAQSGDPVSQAGGVAGDDVHHRVSGSVSVPTVNPLMGYTLVYTGSINEVLYFNAYVNDDDFITINSDDLVSLGFEVSHQSHSYVKLTREGYHVYAFTQAINYLQLAERSYASESQLQ